MACTSTAAATGCATSVIPVGSKDKDTGCPQGDLTLSGLTTDAYNTWKTALNDDTAAAKTDGFKQSFKLIFADQDDTDGVTMVGWGVTLNRTTFKDTTGTYQMHMASTVSTSN